MKILTKLMLILSMSTLYSQDYQVGDIIFTTYRPCRVCQVIEDETGGPYSHLGIIVKITNSEVLVADSLGVVKTSNAKDFIEKSAYATLYRIKPNAINTSRGNFEKSLFIDYEERFKGLKYDRFFQWDNVDDEGNELLYCSEFVSKLINPYFNTPVPTKPMNYTKNYDFWVKYFRDIPIPQDQPGINPDYLSKQPQLEFIKVLKNTIDMNAI